MSNKTRQSRNLALLSAVLIAAVSLNAAYADENDGYTAAYSKCMDNSGGVTSEMLSCQDTELKKQDRLLNDAYKKAMKILDDGQKKQLKEGQKAWLKMRDADAGLMGTLSGGTMDRLNASSVFLEYTVQRVKFLNSLSE